MTIRQFLVGCCMLIVGSSLTNAQTDFRQRQLTMDDGLPSNSVRILMQDERGFLWMGTDNDIFADWEKGIFTDNFRGSWGMFGGQLVFMELSYEGDDYNLYAYRC